jgi:hypothetical protein
MRFLEPVRAPIGASNLDYLLLAAAPALLRRESQLDGESHGALLRPGILICISRRERPVARMFRQPWRLQLDAKQADFIIATSSRRSEACADYLPSWSDVYAPRPKQDVDQARPSHP